MEEREARKLLHRRLKDVCGFSISPEFRNFLVCLLLLAGVILYLGGKPAFREKVTVVSNMLERSVVADYVVVDLNILLGLHL